MLFIPQFYTFDLSPIFFFLSLIFTTVLCLGLFELITTDRLFFPFSFYIFLIFCTGCFRFLGILDFGPASTRWDDVYTGFYH